eukprot:1044195-Pelagomonas_calceolata.AAC.1
MEHGLPEGTPLRQVHLRLCRQQQQVEHELRARPLGKCTSAIAFTPTSLLLLLSCAGQHQAGDRARATLGHALVA